ncbi:MULTISPECIES: glycosyltransferase family 4 protein [Campylobacter]|uniref:glycosyltransferase family 4 protein n=1 Tax=Campylobacter TaxID=194 RepID=UPI00127C786D|nr:glycosyltransferase family 4 protein [Campylobacter sp. RKI_CA19_01122]EAK0812042.1 glycosyltransferase family 4 protein [Campylobacter lari]EAK1250048.1 glycosyltransferase family 4 protein [Campylobacter lari]EAK9888776.1 glycosyltransferase family 4 protein [Campylobacter lari]MCV3356315.1 glycosyltransferase family 4 protein [Campylobacter sp. RKI_CA19_01122]
MKILLLIGDITIGGGAERVVVNLANALFELGYDVKIFSFYKQGVDVAYELNDNIKIDYLHSKSRADVKKERLFYKLYYKHYECFLLKQRYKDADVMIFNNCPHFPFFKNKNTKYINFIHMSLKKYRRKNNYFDALVVLSAKQINQWRKYHKNVWVIPNFLYSKTSLQGKLQIKNILSVGRMALEDQKGFLRLIEIWKLVQKNVKYKEWTLTIVGEGEFKNTIENKIKENNLENSIILKPFTKDIEKEYLNASVYVMTSKWEGFGMVLIESANYQIPSIAFDINTGPSDIIENGKSGYLIEDSNLQEFANKLCLLMDDEKLRKQMGQSAKENISYNFSKEKVMQKWQELLNS